MGKIIKHVEFVLENCEVIIIPYQCFKTLSINGSEDLNSLKDGDAITNMECDIINNGIMSYGYGFNNQESPIERLNNSNDICAVNFIYNDDTSISMRIEWYQDENNYYNQPQYNENQTSNKLNYNSIHIEIKPFIRTYSIQEVFEFEVGTYIEDENGVKYIISDNGNGKFIEEKLLSAKMVNMKYTLLSF